MDRFGRVGVDTDAWTALALSQVVYPSDLDLSTTLVLRVANILTLSPPNDAQPGVLT